MNNNLDENQSNNGFVFRAAISQAFKNISQTVSEDDFRTIFNEIFKQKSSVAGKLYRVFTDELYRSTNSELDEIIKEGSLIEGLAKIAALKEETDLPNDYNCWRPPSDVKLHLRSHNALKIKEECLELEAQIAKLERENAKKIGELSERRKIIQASQEQTTRLFNRSKNILPRLEKAIDIIDQCSKGIDNPDYLLAD